jgi:hypothetical protein
MRLTGCQLHAPVWDITAQSIGNQLTIVSCPPAQILAVPFAKTVLKLIVNCFYPVKGFDDNRKGILVGHTRVSIFILFLPINDFLKAKSTE